MDKHALVFGGSGLLGWGAVNELLAGYPESGVFSRVTAIANRPLGLEDSHWPDTSSRGPELQIVSGIDLRRGTGDDLAKQLQNSIAEIQTVTHIFYFVFSSLGDDYIEECKLNCGMMQNVIDAANKLCPELQSFVYSGGTRGYGIYIPGGTFTPPLQESMAECLPDDYAKTVAYPWFRKLLDKAAVGRSWTWTEVCPDAVIGFSPTGSAFSLTLHWAQYLSLYAFSHGIDPAKSQQSGIDVPFPGTEAAFDALFTPVSTSVLGRIAIFASLNPASCGRQVINCLDHADPTTFRELWPKIAECFGLKGTGPREGGDSPSPSAYISEHGHLFAENGKPKAISAGVGAGAKQLDSVGYWLTFDRQLSAEKLRSAGFREDRPPISGWVDAIDKLRSAGIIF